MKKLFFFALLLLPFAALAQSETCPRVWRNGDSLLTDPAPAYQWLRDGQPIPGATERWLVPTEAGRYAVQAVGAPSPAFPFSAGYALAGYVFDELHRPIEGATVRHATFNATTDTKGRFILWINGDKPEEQTPVVVAVEKDGYWRNASRQYISRFDTTETQVMLHTRRVTNRVDATKGGEMAYRGFTLQLPPNAVQTEIGTPYNGTILLSVEGAKPSDPDFGLRMPGGDFAAIDEGGNDVMLYSYGYLSAEMTTESGEKLELRPEARATLHFYLPYTETHRPDRVPLWHFNTETAVWEQEGWSVRNGSIYEGEVSHFSSWNCDWPAERGTARGRVIDCNDEPVKGGWVRVGQQQVATDSLGNYWTFVPGGITFDAWAASDTLRSVAVPVMEERTLEDLTGRDFTGAGVYDPQMRTLKVHLHGNVSSDLRLSIDGGQSWTGEREFADLSAAPSELSLNDECLGSLPLITLKRQEDCRLLTEEELGRETAYITLEDALSAERAYKLNLDARFSGEWDLLLHLNCLHWLSLWDNRLTSLPKDISQHASLRWLNLSVNELTSLPESAGNLANLQSLILVGNRLTSLPQTVGNLASLKQLGLFSNELTSLPESIENLDSLQELGLGKNRLASFPESIGNLASLRTLDLQDNRLTDLPASLSNLADTLQSLNLQGNPIPVERRAAIQAMLPNTQITWE